MSAALLWFILGFAFFVLEFIVPGFILFFFGAGAWIVALCTLVTDISLDAQLLLFLGTTTLSAGLLRKYLKDKIGLYREQDKPLEDEFIGKTAIAETPISPGNKGKVAFKGTSWDAASTDTIAAGQQVVITETQSILLIVKQA